MIFFLQKRGDLFLECMTFEEGIVWLSRNAGNYVSTLRNIPEERKSPWHRGRSMKSRMDLWQC